MLDAIEPALSILNTCVQVLLICKHCALHDPIHVWLLQLNQMHHVHTTVTARYPMYAYTL